MAKDPLVFSANLFLAFVVFLVGGLSMIACFDAYGLLPCILVWLRVEYLVVLAVAALALGLVGNWLVLRVCLLAILPNLIALVPYLYSPAGLASYHDARLKVFQINVNYGNTQYERVIDYVRDFKPDLLLVQELTEGWAQALESGLPEYPYIAKSARPDPFGIGFYSRLPIVREEVKYYAGTELPSQVISVRWRDKVIRVCHVHPFPPFSEGLMQTQQKLLEELGSDAESADEPVIVAGDFNSPIWSSPMRALLSKAKLRNSAEGSSWQPTWPNCSWMVFGIVIPAEAIKVPIDHCLVNSQLEVAGFAVGKDVGSDHSPLLVELALKGP